MLSFEWLAGAYFALLAAAAPWATAARHRRVGVMIGAAATAVAVPVAARTASVTVREWLPHAYLVLGYWLPALLVQVPPTATSFERWLLRTDEALRPHLPSAPPLLGEAIELAYLMCYPLVPVSFAIVWLNGGTDDVARFWVAVLASGYACYGSLPWLVSRPPRLAVEGRPSAQRVGALNVFVLGRVSHQLNTFPSGHVAVSCASAAVVMTVLPTAGVIVALFAAAIALGAGAGRYHYVVDVVFGIVVGAIAAWSVGAV